MTFDWLDFVAPLDPHVCVMSLILGVAMGTIAFGNHKLALTHVFWMLTVGAAFFIPISVLRALQGSSIWERLLATAVLWVIYVLGMYIGAWFRSTRSQ
jgi:hypothetical protein